MEKSTHGTAREESPIHSTTGSREAGEFLEGVTAPFDPSELSPMSRKRFLALLAASAAFATSGCTNYRDKGEIVPYTRKPEEITPGVEDYYASTCAGCPQHCGVLIKTREGRPIKLDGNAEHPVNRGRLCAKGQASILDLYDPSRVRAPRLSATGRDLSWKVVDAEIRKHLVQASNDSKTILLVCRPVVSATRKKVLDEFVSAYPTTRILSYDLFADMARKEAWEACYGAGPLPVVAWERARILLALESDFLGTDGFTVEQTRRFAATRDVTRLDAFSRLYCVEGAMSLTGTNADYRLRLSPDAQLQFVLALLHEIGITRKAVTLDPSLSSILREHSLQRFSTDHALSQDVLRRLVDDLLAHRGSSFVHAGSVLSKNVHIAANYLNEILGNAAVYDAMTHSSPGLPLSTSDDVHSVINDMRAGKVAVVIHDETNPVYQLPRSLGYAEALKSVPTTVCLSQTENETSQVCGYLLPTHHPLEAWGDYSVRSDVHSLQQPVIAPLYDTRQTEGALLAWLPKAGPYEEHLYHQYMMDHWQKVIIPSLKLPVDVQSFWYSSLHDGVVSTPPSPIPRFTFQKGALTALAASPVSRGKMAMLLTESHFTRDGSFAGNGWLQEIPHPVTKIVWDNYAAISPGTAKSLEVDSGNLVEVATTVGKQVIPVFVQPGMAENFLAVAVGYGRWNAGPVGTAVGTDVMGLIDRTFLNGERVLTDVSVRKVAGSYDLASTQEHHALDDAFVANAHRKRKIIRDGTVDQFRRDPDFLHHERPDLFSISKEVSYPDVKWAMAIDLNKCTGCNACVSSCNVENNIPIVGREQVAKGREMQWIRIDRYFSGTPEEPVPSHQPMLCQHCDQAPCENVCPVVATTHSPDGLNQMVYNRCVGTKYCSNNCPYKVRRFNFFNFRDNFAEGYYLQEPVELVHNPEVTVRSRGVMEKCTFCVQRIMEARQHASEQGVKFSGEGVQTACQQACPAQAIVFGNMNDPASAISEYRKHPLGYYVLEELNVRPNVTYLARLRNTHGEDLA